MYSDIDLDANGMEVEFQAAFEELLWFVNVHLANSRKGVFKIRNRIASRQQKAAYEAAQAANGTASRGGIGSTVAAIGVAMAAMGLASLSSLDDIGKK